MLDFGETLVHDGAALPHVPEALESLSEMLTETGEPLETCLVSDFKMPEPPPTPAKMRAIFEEYIALLENVGLREFFEPTDRRITLSMHAGVSKPDRRVFETAIERLGVSAALTECLFISEQAAHLAACTDLGMNTLHFGSPEGFTDWAEAPMLVAAKLATPTAPNTEKALGVWLRAKHGMQLMNVKLLPRGDRALAEVKTAWPLPASELGGEQLHLELPTAIELSIDDDGRVTSMAPAGPNDEALSEAVHLVKTLKAHGQIALEKGGMPSGATHQVVTDAQGRRVLKRRRFSAT